MKTMTKLIYAMFAVVGLTIAPITSNAAPGDIFVGDSINGWIRRFAPDGTQYPFFTTGQGTIEGLAFDSAGYLFVAEQDASGAIYKFAPDGTRITFATGLINPQALAFDSAGYLFEADFGSGNIYKFAPDGTRSTFASGLNGPTGLAFDGTGYLFAAEYYSGTIYKLAADSTRSTFATGLNLPYGLAFDSAGFLFEADAGSGNIYKFAPDGAPSTVSSGLDLPVALAFDSAGDLFVATHGSFANDGNGSIYKFTPGGTSSALYTGHLSDSFLTFIAIQPPAPYGAQVQPPINADGSSVFNVKRGVVPVKFTLTQSGVATTNLPAATISLIRIAGGALGAIDENTYLSPADSGSSFRIDTANFQYVYNLATSLLGPGEYTVSISINGSVVGSATFGLK